MSYMRERKRTTHLEFRTPTLLVSYSELAERAESGMAPDSMPNGCRHDAATERQKLKVKVKDIGKCKGYR
jgi:hypothetical protein